METVLKNKMDSFFHINRDEDLVSMIETKEGDLDDYIENLITQILGNKKNRHFKFASEHKEVLNLIREILSNESEEVFYNNSKLIAERLLKTEKNTQEKQSNFKELQKGSLIISYYKEDLIKNFIVSKVEYESFLNSSDFLKQSGLPYEKGTLKTCLIQIDINSNEIIDIIITDSNASISKYWSDSFLELEELKDDETNTKSSFFAMDHLITKSLKRKSPNDYSMLRNHLVTYYRTQENFDFDNMLQTVFGDFVPDTPEINIHELKDKANQLPEKKHFDRVFSIKPDVIKARIRKTHKLNSVSELRITGGSDNFRNLIQSKEIEGEKFIQIKTDNEEAFQMFLPKNK